MRPSALGYSAAASYHTTAHEFAKAVLALEKGSLPRTCDFDTQPPEALITALAKYSGYRPSELERLIVHPTGATLRPGQRDAYCPECMREDREQGVILLSPRVRPSPILRRVYGRNGLPLAERTEPI
jgi:hypothetical protein